MKPVKLTELNPRWVRSGGEGVTRADTGEPVPLQEEVGISFDCVCGCEYRVFVSFSKDKEGNRTKGNDPKWERTGKTFEDLTLRPSIQRHKANKISCRWHGHVTNGEVTTC